MPVLEISEIEITKKIVLQKKVSEINRFNYAFDGIIDDFWFSQAIEVNQKVNINWWS